jgi:hypothetical protein
MTVRGVVILAGLPGKMASFIPKSLQEIEGLDVYSQALTEKG